MLIGALVLCSLWILVIASGASIFDHYNKQEVSDGLLITCEKCDNVIKKYFSPKFVS